MASEELWHGPTLLEESAPQVVRLAVQGTAAGAGKNRLDILTAVPLSVAGRPRELGEKAAGVHDVEVVRAGHGGFHARPRTMSEPEQTNPSWRWRRSG